MRWKADSGLALIHAATMVTAGVFMVAASRRCSNWPERADVRHLDRRHHGIFAATVGTGTERHQAYRSLFDLLAAWATCSWPWGSGPILVGMFHLFPTLLQGAAVPRLGCVITAMHHEQDIRLMGGLRTKLPFTYAAMVIGTLCPHRLPAYGRLLLQGCDHRGGLCR